MRCSVIPAGLAGPSLCLRLLRGLLFILLNIQNGGESGELAALQSLPGEGQVGQCKLGSEITQGGRHERDRVKPNCKLKETFVWTRTSYGTKPNGLLLGQ